MSFWVEWRGEGARGGWWEGDGGRGRGTSTWWIASRDVCGVREMRERRYVAMLRLGCEMSGLRGEIMRRFPFPDG